MAKIFGDVQCIGCGVSFRGHKSTQYCPDCRALIALVDELKNRKASEQEIITRIKSWIIDQVSVMPKFFDPFIDSLLKPLITDNTNRKKLIEKIFE